VQLVELKTYQFRNLEDQTIHFEDGVNVIIGNNGQGKTNVLEAISILSSVRSFRSSKLAEAIRWNQSEASIFGTIKSDSEIKTSLGVALDKKTKKAYINDAQVKSAEDFIGTLVCVTFTPDDLELVKGGPSERRRFLDKALAFLDRKIIRALSSYNAALRSKNVLLRNSFGQPRDVLFEQLDSWNKVMAKHGAQIEAARRVLAKNLSDKAAKLYSSFSPESESFELSLKSAGIKKEVSEYLLLEEITEAREREVAQGRSLVGPHRDDLLISLSGIDSRAFASQGQTRSIVLAIKLALIEEIQNVRHEAPIILLDDVDSELDESRRRSFFEAIMSHGRQVIITATNAKDLPIPSQNTNQQLMFEGIISNMPDREMLRLTNP